MSGDWSDKLISMTSSWSEPTLKVQIFFSNPGLKDKFAALSMVSDVVYDIDYDDEYDDTYDDNAMGEREPGMTFTQDLGLRST